MKKQPVSGSKSDGAAANQRSQDLTVFSRAVTLFNAGKFGEAKQLFDQLSGIRDASLAHAARSRALICERRSRPS
jgi:hypothetical protein